MILIIDGDYILNRNVFSLNKDRLLYGNLYESLLLSTETYCNWFPFSKKYFISDTKSNWRKEVYPEYKGNRSKDDVIDWEFVYTTYTEFKESIPHNMILREKPRVEGDDWISYLTKYHNSLGESVLIVSNDGDIKMLIESRKDYMNIMVNEMFNKNYIFLPEDYKTWLSLYSDTLGPRDLFDDDHNFKIEVVNFIELLIHQRDVHTVDHQRILFEKIITGDKGDNIKSVFIKNNRGLGKKSGEKLYDQYVELFGEPKFDSDCFDRMSDLIMEFKKEDEDEIYDSIRGNIEFNNKLVNLHSIPNDIKKLMENYET